MYCFGGCWYFFILVFVIVYGAETTNIAIDVNRNLTILCPIHRTRDVMWIRELPKELLQPHSIVLDNGSLFISQVNQNDSGIYSCSRENVVNSDVKARVNVTIRTPPPALVNVTVRPSTILALLLWEVNGTGGYPIINFTAQFRLAYTNSSWIPISPNHITPNSRQIEVYKLVPNTTYEFRIWATNQLGRGAIKEAHGTTLGVYKEEELARHMLEGADKFDTRVWAVAVGIVMGTLVLLGLGICFLLYQECRIPGVVEEQEIIELVPNIILNPGFDPCSQNESIP
ncbi:hypothetical protein NQ317_009213 [Molorchus minor]|uniref:Uncharacterized protein n=1 Tax=Molorchus minor TaxID=1323400 RepID=A0ABQ9IZ44_9CUCU|nr:hypothetical protein NQ317_009213 [Molorchus minor]